MRTLFLALLTLSAFAHGKSNILLILADDMGYGDIQALNPESKISTPHLDSLVRDGVTFTDAHSPSSVCTPTRYALLTGRYCWRSRLKKGVLFPPKDRPLIDSNRPTIASFLKNKGYQTHIVGKWHLGLDWARDGEGTVNYQGPISDTPVEKGFDSWFGVAASLDMEPYTLFRNHNAISQLTEQQEALPFPRFIRKGPKAADFDPGDILDDIASEADRVIAAASQNESPFFLYLPLTGPHKPVWPHNRFVGKTPLGPYGDFVHQVDHTVGLVLQSLARHNVAEDTLVIYTSDNGSFMYRRQEGEEHHLANPSEQGFLTSDHQANFHWRGTKADIYEGGHRVPFLVRWPGKASKGQLSARTIALTDVFATLADISQSEKPAEAEDSYSFLPALLAQREDLKEDEAALTKEDSRPPVIHHSANGTFAIRDGDWKLILSAGSGGRQAPRSRPFERPYQLYNLATDPSETSNRISDKPLIAQRLETAFAAIARDHQTSQ